MRYFTAMLCLIHQRLQNSTSNFGRIFLLFKLLSDTVYILIGEFWFSLKQVSYRLYSPRCLLTYSSNTTELSLIKLQGKETSDPETGRQCPFFEELHAVFTERAKNMQRLLLESEAGSTQSRKKMKRTSGDRSSDEFSEEEDEDEDDSEEEKPVRSNSRKRKVEKIIAEKSPRASSSTVGGIQEMLKEFLQQQQKMEMQWREMMERRSHERQMFEQEWRQSMEKLERERLMIEQAWREREEQRRIREESRAERRDALLTTLLNKLIRENNI
eukprot:XP_024449351.1 trihelix transcription factor GT-3b isoform X2 [Populus trichocarpa]